MEAVGWETSHFIELQRDHVRLDGDLLKLDDAAPESWEVPAGENITFQANVLTLLLSSAKADLKLRITDPQGALVIES